MLKKSNQKGFSIIEVLIVLAIAGLIMLVVFLAVPALQRSARNSSRSSDAQKLAASINQCITNNNGRNDNCRATGTTGNLVIWDIAEAGQLETATYSTTGATVAPVANSDTSSMVFKFGFTCNGATAAQGTTRQFAIVYQTEGTGSNRQPACLSS